MSSVSLIHWSGGALLLAGAILEVSTLLHPNEVADPEAVLSEAWVIVHTVYIPGFVLALFGLAGLYARLAERGGRLGLAGFVLSFIGGALFLVVVVTEAAIVPAIAASDAGPTLLDLAGPLFGGELGLIFLAGQVAFSVGRHPFRDLYRAGGRPAAPGGLAAARRPARGLLAPVAATRRRRRRRAARAGLRLVRLRRLVGCERRTARERRRTLEKKSPEVVALPQPPAGLPERILRRIEVKGERDDCQSGKFGPGPARDRARLDAFYTAWRVRDGPGMRALFDEDRLLVWDTTREERIEGRAEADREFDGWVDACPPWTSFKVTHREVGVRDGLAWAAEEVTGTWSHERKSGAEHFRITTVWEEHDEWKLVHVHLDLLSKG